MNRWVYHLLLIVLLLGSGTARAQEHHTEVCINFRVNRCVIDSTYMDNGHRLATLDQLLDSIRQDSTLHILRLTLSGAASPEDSYQHNLRLAEGRLEALEEYITGRVEIPDSLIVREDGYIDWHYLKERVEASNLTLKNQIVDIINSESHLVPYNTFGALVDSRIVRLKRLNGGKVWQQLKRLYFRPMRKACVVVSTYKEEPAPTLLTSVEYDIAVPCGLSAEELIVIPCDPIAAPSREPQLRLKTDAVGWGMAIANVAVEVDIAAHWSLTLPLYYSAWNYFTSTTKFRTLAIQPEARYWFRGDNSGLFVGAHLGMGYYNFALGGDYRYQDHSGNTPAMGGGLAVGYRWPFGNGDRWGVELSLGGGAYRLHYDKFLNTPNTHEGLKVGSHESTYWGIDRASVSLSYAFDLNKKGGGR